MAKHQPQLAPKPSLPLNSIASAEPQKPAPAPPRISDAVLVKTAVMISGVSEHAAIVTHVYGDGDLDVLLMPRGTQPYPVSRVKPADSGAALSWRARS